MARVKQTQPKTPSPSSSSSGRTPSPPPTISKRVPIPTHKILAKEKGKVAAVDQGKLKKRKEPLTEKLMADATKEVTQKKRRKRFLLLLQRKLLRPKIKLQNLLSHLIF